MKKIIILLLALLMSACSAVKPSEILSSMQTEPTAETTVPSVTESPEQKPALETTVVTTMEAPTEPIKAETTTEPPTAQEMPIETVEEDKPTEITGNCRNAA